jgi:glycine betaine/proline transport system ATP-binding protein
VAAFTNDVDHSRVLTAEFVMKPADVLVMGRDAIQTALNRISAMDNASAMYVVDGDQKLKGFIDKQKFLGAVKGGGIEKISDVLEQNFPRITKSTSLSDIYALCADGMPIAVMDKAGRLQGVVNPLDIFTSLASNESDGDSETNGVEESESATVKL